MKYIIDDNDKNKHEAYTKQEVLNVIQEAITTGELPEELNGLVLTFKNPIDNKGYKIAFCTQAKYNELEARGQLEADCLYFITDDNSYDDLVESLTIATDEIEGLNDDVTSLQSRVARLENPIIEVAYEEGEDKTVNTGYSVRLAEGTELYVRFMYYGSSTPWHYMTLNVNNTGQKYIAALGSVISPNDRAAWSNSDVVRLVYTYNSSVNDYVWEVRENITKHMYFGTLYEA